MFLGHFCYWTLFVVTVTHYCASDCASGSITLFLIELHLLCLLCCVCLYCIVKSHHTLYIAICPELFFSHYDLLISRSLHMVLIMFILFLTFGWCSYQGWFTITEQVGFKYLVQGRGHFHPPWMSMVTWAAVDLIQLIISLLWLGICFFRGHHAALACDVCCDHDCTLNMKAFKALVRPLTSKILYFSQTTVMFI